METISYRAIKDTSSADMEKMPYKIKCRGLIFKKEYNWYYSKKYSLDDIANNGDDCEIIEWEEPEITQEEILQQRIDKAIEYIEEHNIPYTSYLGKERQVNKLELIDEKYDKLLSILRGEE